MRALMPWTRMTNTEIERLLNRFLEGKLEESWAGAEWAPSMDVKGEKRQEQEDKEEHYHRVERTYGMFARSVRLPVTVDGSKVVAIFKNGLLTITLPKTPTSKGTTIPIKAE